MEYFAVFGCLAIGILIGVVITLLWRPTDGIIRIDHSNPEKDLYRFEIDNLELLEQKKKIILKIDHYADLSQK